MNDMKNKIPLEDELLARVSGSMGADTGCGLEERDFPKAGKCFHKSSTIAGAVFQQACHRCSIWDTLPEGESLQVAYMFECNLYGYSRRMKGD